MILHPSDLICKAVFGLIQLFIFGWGTVLYGFENAVKCGQTAKSRTHCHFGDGNIRLNQQRFRVSDSFLSQILIAGHAGELLEQSGKVEFGKAGKISKGVHIDIFCTMIGDVIADIHKFFDIFVLFAGSDAGEFFTCIKIGTADGNKKMNDQCIDIGFRESDPVIVFAADFIQIGNELTVQFRVFFPADESIRMQGMDQRVHSFYIADQAVVQKDDKPFAFVAVCIRCWRDQTVQRAGRRYEDIAFPESMGCFVDDDRIFFPNGHNNFHCGMPVERIIFRLHIVIKFDAWKVVVCNRFVDAVQDFYHVRNPRLLYLYRPRIGG